MACALLACLLGAQTGYGQAVLEDFSSMRTNGAGTDLWMTEINRHQNLQIENGTLKSHITGPAKEKDKSYLWRIMFYPHQGDPRYPFPKGFLQGNLRSGSWNPDYNRLVFWVKCSAFVPFNPWLTFDVGTYVKSHDSDPEPQGQHYYHYFHPNLYPNQWVKAEMTWAPTHRVSADGWINHPVDPEWRNGSSPSSVHYFDGMTRFYIDLPGIPARATSCAAADFRLERESDEPDGYVRTVTATYNGSGYELSWNGIKNEKIEYEIRYSPESMKNNGFESGVTGGKVKSTGISRAGVLWKSEPMEREPGGMYFAIRPSNSSSFNEIYLPDGPAIPASSNQSACSQYDRNRDGVVSVADIQAEVSDAIYFGDKDREASRAHWEAVAELREMVLTGPCAVVP